MLRNHYRRRLVAISLVKDNESNNSSQAVPRSNGNSAFGCDPIRPAHRQHDSKIIPGVERIP